VQVPQWRDRAEPYTNARLRTQQKPSEVLRWPRTRGVKTAAVPQVPRHVAATACGTPYGFGVPQRLLHRTINTDKASIMPL
jgi:hypothetical protein